MDIKDFRRSNNVEDDRHPPGWPESLYETLSLAVPPVAVRKALQLSDWLGLSPRLGIAPPMWNLPSEPTPPGSMGDQAGVNQMHLGDPTGVNQMQAERPRRSWPRDVDGHPLPPNIGAGSPPIPGRTYPPGSIADMLNRVATGAATTSDAPVPPL
jgi:hypothetical protein